MLLICMNSETAMAIDFFIGVSLSMNGISLTGRKPDNGT
jgi:hypothetical protein